MDTAHRGGGRPYLMPTIFKGAHNRSSIQTYNYAKSKPDLAPHKSGYGWPQGGPFGSICYTAGLVEALELTQEAVIELMSQMGYGWACMEQTLFGAYIDDLVGAPQSFLSRRPLVFFTTIWMQRATRWTFLSSSAICRDGRMAGTAGLGVVLSWPQSLARA